MPAITTFSPEDDIELMGLFKEGLSKTEISRRMKRPAQTIGNRLEVLTRKARYIPRTPPGALHPRRNRPCMCCKKTFMSEGPHNRLCGNCRTKSTTPFDL